MCMYLYGPNLNYATIFLSVLVCKVMQDLYHQPQLRQDSIISVRTWVALLLMSRPCLVTEAVLGTVASDLKLYQT